MHKFEQKDYCDGLYIYDKFHDRLFHTFNGFAIGKENSKGNSCCYEYENSYDYHGLSNVYLSNSHSRDSVCFTPKRITVIQMK